MKRPLTSSGGKGSKPRPSNTSKQIYDLNYDLIFGTPAQKSNAIKELAKLKLLKENTL